MPKILLAKQKGEWAEVCFAAEILRRGWRIARPYGESAPYDCIVDVRGRILRVQVKGVAHARKNTRFPYVVKLIRGRFNHLSYSGREIDVIAVLIVPKSVWYIVPISAIEGWKHMGFGGNKHVVPLRRQRISGKLEKYREAWWVLRGSG